jgi:transcriptional regulator with XRE-family HTH domain
MSVHLDPTAIGARIRTVRLAAGFPILARFARAIDAEPKTLYRLERGLNIPSAETTVAIAHLGSTRTGVVVTTDWLLTGVGEPHFANAHAAA